MDRRSVAAAVVVLLLVVNLALVGLVLYPFSETDPLPPEDAFEVGESDAYRIEATITTDGETSLAVDGAVERSGERYVRVVQETVTTEQYQRNGSAAQYTRYVVDGENADRRLQDLESDPEQEVISTDREDGTLRAVVVDNDSRTAPDPTGAASVVSTQLRLAVYDQVGSASESDRQVLEPQSGWYDGSRSYRLTDASGTVVVDPETNVLHAANVTWDLTKGTSTYAHYLLNRGNSVEQGVTYEYQSGNVSVETPDWVEDATDGSPQ